MDPFNHERTAFPPAQRRSTAPEVFPGAPAEEQPTGGEPGGVARTTQQAARAVMHPDWQDTDWRYYHGAWGG